MSEDKIGPWYCVGCGMARSLEDFGQPCRYCGGYAMACDEEHRLTLAALERGMTAEIETLREDLE